MRTVKILDLTLLVLLGLWVALAVVSLPNGWQPRAEAGIGTFCDSSQGAKCPNNNGACLYCNSGSYNFCNPYGVFCAQYDWCEGKTILNVNCWCVKDVCNGK